MRVEKADGADQSELNDLLGRSIRVHGLQARPEYNGESGKVVSVDHDKGRAGVCLDSGPHLWIKPSNLVWFSDASTPPLKGSNISSATPRDGSHCPSSSTKGNKQLTFDAAKAAVEGDIAGVAGWLDQGGSIDATCDMPDGTVCGVTMLMFASSRGHELLVDTLLRRSATVDQKSSNGRTALMNAAFNGHASIVDRLLQSGATPLHGHAP
jgi:hypothetical protein